MTVIDITALENTGHLNIFRSLNLMGVPLIGRLTYNQIALPEIRMKSSQVYSILLGLHVFIAHYSENFGVEI